MIRCFSIVFALGLVGITGCLHNGDWTWEQALGWEKVRTPKPPKFSPASLQTSERVETLGRRIIAQNTFTGLDPLFHTIGVPELVLFHRGTAELYISEGLVNRCKTEPELAAVLATELGEMMAEQRAARSVGRDKDPIPDVALPGGPNTDFTRDAEIASQEKRLTRVNTNQPAADPAKLSRDLLRGAGFEPSELDRIEPLLKLSDRGEILRKQMAGSGPAPKWER